MTKKTHEDKILDHIRAIAILHRGLKKEDEFYYKAYIADEIESLIKTVKKWKPSLLKSISNCH